MTQNTPASEKIPDVEAVRLAKAFQVGKLVLAGRKRLRLSQDEFGRQIGVSRKTLSDLERGLADHISLTTFFRAMSLIGMRVHAEPNRMPDINEVLAIRARELTRIDKISELRNHAVEIKVKRAI